MASSSYSGKRHQNSMDYDVEYRGAGGASYSQYEKDTVATARVIKKVHEFSVSVKKLSMFALFVGLVGVVLGAVGMGYGISAYTRRTDAESIHTALEANAQKSLTSFIAQRMCRGFDASRLDASFVCRTPTIEPDPTHEGDLLYPFINLDFDKLREKSLYIATALANDATCMEGDMSTREDGALGFETERCLAHVLHGCNGRTGGPVSYTNTDLSLGCMSLMKEAGEDLSFMKTETVTNANDIGKQILGVDSSTPLYSFLQRTNFPECYALKCATDSNGWYTDAGMAFASASATPAQQLHVCRAALWSYPTYPQEIHGVKCSAIRKGPSLSLVKRGESCALDGFISCMPDLMCAKGVCSEI